MEVYMVLQQHPQVGPLDGVAEGGGQLLPEHSGEGGVRHEAVAVEGQVAHEGPESPHKLVVADDTTVRVVTCEQTVFSE